MIFFNSLIDFSFLKSFLFISYIFFVFSACSHNNNKSILKKPIKPTHQPKISKLNKQITQTNIQTNLSFKIKQFQPIRIIPISDLIPNYIEKIQLNNRTLSRQRYKTVIYGEKKASRERFYLAVLLWRLSIKEEAELGEKPSLKASEQEIIKYRKKLKKIENYRLESLFHLDYLVKRNRVSPAIMERWAYYYAQLKGIAAIPRFYKLMSHPKVPDKRYYVLDFANLLLADQRCNEAKALLSIGIPKKHRKRLFKFKLKLQLCKLHNKTENKKFWLSKCKKIPNGLTPIFMNYMAKSLILSGFFNPTISDEIASECDFTKNSTLLALWKHTWNYIYKQWHINKIYNFTTVWNIKEKPTKILEFLTYILQIYLNYTKNLSKIQLKITSKNKKIETYEKVNPIIFNIIKPFFNNIKIKPVKSIITTNIIVNFKLDNPL